MAYVLFDRREQGTPQVVKRYADRKGALIGMRAANRRAGWSRIGVTPDRTGICEMEWSLHSEHDQRVYDHAPYVIANEFLFDQKYSRDKLVPVKNLMSGETVLIARRDRGTCVDPSTEQYWSM
jgi:hypothetical protein